MTHLFAYLWPAESFWSIFYVAVLCLQDWLIKYGALVGTHNPVFISHQYIVKSTGFTQLSRTYKVRVSQQIFFSLFMFSHWWSFQFPMYRAFYILENWRDGEKKMFLKLFGDIFLASIGDLSVMMSLSFKNLKFVEIYYGHSRNY